MEIDKSGPITVLIQVLHLLYVTAVLYSNEHELFYFVLGSVNTTPETENAGKRNFSKTMASQ